MSHSLSQGCTCCGAHLPTARVTLGCSCSPWATTGTDTTEMDLLWCGHVHGYEHFGVSCSHVCSPTGHIDWSSLWGPSLSSSAALAICQPSCMAVAVIRMFPGTAEYDDKAHGGTARSESKKQSLTSTRLEYPVREASPMASTGVCQLIANQQ